MLQVRLAHGVPYYHTTFPAVSSSLSASRALLQCERAIAEGRFWPDRREARAVLLPPTRWCPPRRQREVPKSLPPASRSTSCLERRARDRAFHSLLPSQWRKRIRDKQGSVLTKRDVVAKSARPISVQLSGCRPGLPGAHSLLPSVALFRGIDSGQRCSPRPGCPARYTLSRQNLQRSTPIPLRSPLGAISLRL